MGEGFTGESKRSSGVSCRRREYLNFLFLWCFFLPLPSIAKNWGGQTHRRLGSVGGVSEPPLLNQRVESTSGGPDPEANLLPITSEPPPFLLAKCLDYEGVDLWGGGEGGPAGHHPVESNGFCCFFPIIIFCGQKKRFFLHEGWKGIKTPYL